MTVVLIAFGANLGAPEKTLAEMALALSEIDGIEVAQVSPAFITPSIGGNSAQPDYVNAAIRAETQLSPEILLQKLLLVEQAFGRNRQASGERWASRTIDLDLLIFGDQIVDRPSLVLPHPRMSFRRFVLVPANAIAPQMIHPVSGQTINQLLKKIDKKNFFVLLAIGKNFSVSSLSRLLAAKNSGLSLVDEQAVGANKKIPTSGLPLTTSSQFDSLTHVRFIRSDDEFVRYETNARLVISLREHNSFVGRDAWLSKAAAFRGPALRIVADPSQQEAIQRVAEEIIAACKAMRPFPSAG